MFNGKEIMMINTAIENYMGHLKFISDSTNDPGIADSICEDLAEYSILYEKILKETFTDGENIFNEVSIVKSKSLSGAEKIMAVYSNENDAKEYIEKNKELLKAYKYELCYENIQLKM